MRVLFVVPYPEGQAASQRYRVEQWFPFLERQHIEYTLVPFWSQRAWPVLYRKGHTAQKALYLVSGFLNRLLLLPQLPYCDFVFVHREATPVGPPWFEWVAAKVFRKKLIFDFDDAIWLPSTSAGNTWAAKYKRPKKVSLICAFSTKVCCGNSYLRSFAKQYNLAALYLPTVLDTSGRYGNLKLQRTEKVTIGWIGSHSTLPYLKLIEPVLQRLEQDYLFDFIVIADKAPPLQLKSMKFRKWRAQTEVQDLLELNIGLMPLPDTEWAKGKCAFKALQYMALGIPAVVSAVGANIEAVPNGEVGYTCAAEQEWYERLAELLSNKELREQMGKRGQNWVQRHYSVNAHQQTFLNLFT